MLSNVSVMVSPSLVSRPPQHGQLVGDGSHPLARQVRRQRCAYGLGARERAHRRPVCDRTGSGRFVFGGCRLEFLELDLQLVEQLAPTLGGGAEAVTLHLCDQ